MRLLRSLRCVVQPHASVSVDGCSPDHSPLLVSFSRPLRTALLRACSQPHVFLLLSAADLLAPLVLLASRISLLLSSPFASHRSFSSRPLRTSLHAALGLSPHASPVGGCSPDHFPLARLPRLAAYIRRRCSRVLFASFIRALGSLALASLSSALLCSRLCSSRASLSSLLLSCLAFSLFSPRASPSASSLLVPRLQPLLSSCLAFPFFQARHPLITSAAGTVVEHIKYFYKTSL